MRFILYNACRGEKMKIKEVENLLSISRSNIRFYEQEGLLKPKRGENSYRDYSEEDVNELKKILALRKIGFTVEEISAMQKGELSLSDALCKDIERLEKEIISLQGALKIAKYLSSENISFETIDQDYLWDKIVQSEHNGLKYVDICKDYLKFEQNLLDIMWKYVFSHDFKKSRKKFGTTIAIGIVLLICVLRGILKVVIVHESFWDGFLYPFIIFVAGSIIILPIYILSKKAPKIASIISKILLIVGIIFISTCILVILYSIVKTILS